MVLTLNHRGCGKYCDVSSFLFHLILSSLDLMKNGGRERKKEGEREKKRLLTIFSSSLYKTSFSTLSIFKGWWITSNLGLDTFLSLFLCLFLSLPILPSDGRRRERERRNKVKEMEEKWRLTFGKLVKNSKNFEINRKELFWKVTFRGRKRERRKELSFPPTPIRSSLFSLSYLFFYFFFSLLRKQNLYQKSGRKLVSKIKNNSNLIDVWK